MISFQNKRILVFHPISEIWSFSFPLYLLCNDLKARFGAEITVLGCAGGLEGYCTVNECGRQSDLFEAKQRLMNCKQCRRSLSALQDGFMFNLIHLDSFYSEADLVDLDNCQDASLRDFSHRGINLFKVAGYEYLLNKKKFDPDFSSSELAIMRGFMRSCLKTMIATQRALDQTEFDVAITFNSLYSANHSFAQVCQLNGVPFYSMEPTYDLRPEKNFIFAESGYFQHYRGLIENWDHLKDLSARQTNIETIRCYAGSYLAGLKNSKSVLAYSTKASGVNVRQLYSLNENPIVLVAMSSEDEMAAAISNGTMNPGRRIFETQHRWLEWVIGFASRNPNLNFIIRFHPREFPNRRNKSQSDLLGGYLELLSKIPRNIRVNTPNDAVSLYDFIGQTKLLLFSWSSVGKEFALAGVNSLTYCPDLLLFPKQVVHHAYDLETYQNQVTALCATVETAKGDDISIWVYLENYLTTIRMERFLNIRAEHIFFRAFWRLVRMLRVNARLIMKIEILLNKRFCRIVYPKLFNRELT